MADVVAIIPARFGSTRFPGKVIADIGGKPLIQHVYERASRAASVSRITVATDDERVADVVKSFDGEVIMTSPHHKSGTDRVAEAAKSTGGEIILNVQGDEPLIEPDVIDAVCNKLQEDEEIVCSTAASPVTEKAIYEDPHAVKVIVDLRGRALYFSRSPIPYYRDDEFRGTYLHAGIYCFRRTFLERYTFLEQTRLEKAEKLEQLRILEHGYSIGVVLTDYHSIGVDTEEDLEMVRRLLKNSKNNLYT
ncbi:3-deoxy-manno-octulosonate cytidylyltransferase [Candidatus Latescibacterota bacterium]